MTKLSLIEYCFLAILSLLFLSCGQSVGGGESGQQRGALTFADAAIIGGFYTRIYKYEYSYSNRKKYSSSSSAQSQLRSFIASKCNSALGRYPSISSYNIYIVSYYSRYSSSNGYYYDITWYWTGQSTYDSSDKNLVLAYRRSLEFYSVKWCPYKVGSSSSSTCSNYYNGNYVTDPANPTGSYNTPSPYSYYTPNPNGGAASSDDTSSSSGNGWVTPVVICSIIFVLFVVFYVKAKNQTRANNNAGNIANNSNNNNTAFGSPLMSDYNDLNSGGGSKGTTEMQEFLVGGGVTADPVQPSSSSGSGVNDDWNISSPTKSTPNSSGGAVLGGGGVYSDHAGGATGKVYCADGTITSGNGSAPAGWGSNDAGDWGGHKKGHTAAPNWGSGW